MNKVKPTKAWSISLIVCNLCSLIIAFTGIIGVELPDMVKRIMCIIMLVSLPVVAYTTVKMFMNMEKQ